MAEFLAFVSTVLGLPNFFGLNQPEIYTFTVNDHKYSLVSGVAGIFNHAHKLIKVDAPANSPGSDIAVFYFKVETEYFHSHPSKGPLYYVGTDDEIYYYNRHNSESKKVGFLEFDAGHRHAINLIKHV